MKELIEDCKENYKEEAHTYDQRRFRSRSGRLYDLIQKQTILGWLKDSKKILDAGCGTGRFSIELAKAGHEVVAFDNSPEMLDILKYKANKENLNIDRHIGDIFHLPFEDGSFDAVNCIWVLRHFDDEHVMLAIKELKRVLKQGGLLIFDAPNGAILKYLSFSKVFQQYNPKTIDRHFDIEKLKQDLEKEGLSFSEAKFINKLPMLITRILLCLPLYTFMFFFEKNLNYGMNALLLFEVE